MGIELELIKTHPDFINWIEDALLAKNSAEEIEAAVKYGLNREVEDWDAESQRTIHAKKEYKEYADKARFYLRLIEEKGLEAYIDEIKTK